MFGADPATAERWLDDWSESVSSRAEQSWRLSEKVAGLSVTADGDQGAVEVTVDGSGVVTDLKLAERVRQMPASRLAELILVVTKRAQGMLADRVAELTADTVGTESPSGRALVAGYAKRFPAPAPEEDRQALVEPIPTRFIDKPRSGRDGRGWR
jgi:DNA-binding protein YbaB